MSSVDDPVEAALLQETDSEGIGPSILELSAAFVPIVSSALDFFSARALKARISRLVLAVNYKINLALSNSGTNREMIEEIKERMESAEFVTAFTEASRQAAHAADVARIQRLADALGGALVSSNWSLVANNLIGLIRALSQLEVEDIRVLGLLSGFYAREIQHQPNFHDPNPYTARVKEILHGMDAAGIHRDDYYSVGRRLEGFGLAIEVMRNPSWQAPGEYCFRPTRRGATLISLLGGIAKSE